MSVKITNKEIKNNYSIEFNEFEKLKNIYIKVFNELFEKKLEYWKYAEELSILTNTTMTQVYNIVGNCDTFVMNSKGKITTRQIYKNNSSFWKKLIDSYQGKIN